jgi:phytoene synthase
VVADAAYAVCLRLARQHYENFPVASRLLPRSLRPHIAAVYAFARIADDFADEGARSEQARLVLLDDWQARLDRAVAGDVVRDGSDAAAIFVALGETMRTCGLERGLFEDLLSAFRQDVLVKRYDTWDDLLDYCRRSANPIGRLVLRISGYRRDTLDRHADAICTALQLTNFWQDLEHDWAKGRLYVPRDVSRAAGADEADLARRRMTPPWRQALAEAARRTRSLFVAGRPVADGVRGRLVWELRATWAGGVRILDRLEAARFEVFGARPAIGWKDGPAIVWAMLTWRRRPVTRTGASGYAADPDR